MDYRSNSTRLLIAGRLLAIVAMFVLLFGRTIHLGQERGDCCSVSSSQVHTEKAPTKQVRPCPYGCCHHDEQADSDKKSGKPERDKRPGHDEHHCAVCSVFAQAPSCVAVVGLTIESDVVVETITFESASVATVTFLSAQPRGPPCTA